MSSAAAKVAVLAGGPSLERDVSLRSGLRVAQALQELGHDVARLDLDDDLVPALTNRGFAAVYLALHGKSGEDGTIQSLLDGLAVPYTGPDAVASALAWDKAMSKGLWRRAGLLTPDWIALSADAVQNMGAARALDQLVKRLGLPVVVKPTQGGAFMGVRFVSDRADLNTALLSAFNYHDVVLVERFVDGTEVAVSIVEDRPLPPVEIVPKAGAYDFAARYTAGATDFYAPARLDDATLRRCRDIATAAGEVLGCRHVARADLMVDSSGQPWLLELQTCPGMTETSLLPMAANAAGWEFPQLCGRILDLALDQP